MPMTPHKGESQSDFMGRCMHETFTGDRTQEQAGAICYQYWRDAKGGKKPPSKEAKMKTKQEDDEVSADDLAQDTIEVQEGDDEDDFIDRCMDDLFQDHPDVDSDVLREACQQVWDDSKSLRNIVAKDYADTGYQPDGRKRFPLDTTNQIRSAWYTVNTEKVKALYTAAQLSRIVTRTSLAWKAKISEVGPCEPSNVALRAEVIKITREYYAPEPKDGETHDAYLERCVDAMSDDMDDDVATMACQLRWDECADNGGGYDRSAGPIMHKTHAAASDGMEFILSDATPDRFADVIDVDGWEYEAFANNPIALFNHDKAFPIGKWKNVRKHEGQSLRGELVLAPKGTSQRIDEIRRLIEADILRAVSVGFRPLEHEPINAKDPWGGTRYKKSELVEASLVSVPANPNALSVARSLNISPSTVRMVFGEHAGNDIVRRDAKSLPAPRGEHAGKREAGKQNGEHAETNRESRKGKAMLLSQRITEAEKNLLALQDNIERHLESIDDDSPSEEQMVLTEDLTAKIETASRHLRNLKAIEVKNAKGAEDIEGASKRGTNGSRAPASLPATPKKLRDARRKGQVPHSRDVVAGAGLIAAVVYLLYARSIIEARVTSLVDLVAAATDQPFTETW